MQETTLIIFAHPEPKSFNGSWAQASVEAAEELGQNVLYSDLVSMGFDPVEKKSHYQNVSTVDKDSPFDPLYMQDLAAKQNCLPRLKRSTTKVLPPAQLALRRGTYYAPLLLFLRFTTTSLQGSAYLLIIGTWVGI